MLGNDAWCVVVNRIPGLLEMEGDLVFSGPERDAWCIAGRLKAGSLAGQECGVYVVCPRGRCFQVGLSCARVSCRELAEREALRAVPRRDETSRRPLLDLAEANREGIE